MEAKYERVKEVKGEDLKQAIENGIEAVVKAIEDVIEKGKKYRISVQDKGGDIKFKTTVTIGAFGLSLAIILMPIFTILAGTVAFVAGTAYDYKLVVDKVVDAGEGEPEKKPD